MPSNYDTSEPKSQTTPAKRKYKVKAKATLTQYRPPKKLEPLDYTQCRPFVAVYRQHGKTLHATIMAQSLEAAEERIKRHIDAAEIISVTEKN